MSDDVPVTRRRFLTETLRVGALVGLGLVAWLASRRQDAPAAGCAPSAACDRCPLAADCRGTQVGGPHP